MLAQGWSNIHFASPLAELSVLLGLNFLALILYVDACISPSGTGIIYLGASTRMLTAMSQHGQVPGYFSKITKYQISRRSLLCTFILCLTVVIFFRNWQSIAVLTTTFILVSCFALTISYARLLVDKKITEASFKLKGGALVAFLVFLFLNYLFTGLPTLNIIIMLILNFTLFGVYTILQSRNNWALVLTKIKNTWSIFLYFIYLLLFAWLNGIYPILSHSIISAFISYLIIPAALFFSMVYQKNHDAGPERGTVN
jgi:amino acid transporter